MPCHRSNKSASRGRSGGGEPWFSAHKKRQRKREKLARAMRQKQRR